MLKVFAYLDQWDIEVFGMNMTFISLSEVEKIRQFTNVEFSIKLVLVVLLRK